MTLCCRIKNPGFTSLISWAQVLAPPFKSHHSESTDGTLLIYIKLTSAVAETAILEVQWPRIESLSILKEGI